MLVVNHFNGVARLLDNSRDNPLELTVAAQRDTVEFVLVDRDEGNEWSILVDRAELDAALAVSRIESTCEDCQTSPVRS